MTGEPRLTVEIIPTSLHGKNPRTAMGKAMWERQRKRVCEAAGNRCEICGGVGKRHPVEIHERYEYDETQPASLPEGRRPDRLVPRLPRRQASGANTARGQTAGRSVDLRERLRHLARVNDWDAERVRDYLAEVQDEFRRREALGNWAQDFSSLRSRDTA